MTQPQGRPAHSRSDTDRLTARALELQWERWPDLRSSFTDEQVRQTEQDTRFHVECLVAAIWSDEPVIFGDYVVWVRVLFRSLGMPLEWLLGSLDDIRVAAKEVLPASEASAAVRIIDAALANPGAEDPIPLTELREDRPLGDLLARYVGGMLSGDRAGITRALLDAADTDATVADIYTYVLGPAQRELGRLWQLGRISAAQEHYATAVTQMVMSQLHNRMRLEQPRGLTIVGACVAEERHDVGLRMVVDFFEMDGWDTHYLGAGVPARDLVDIVADRQAQVIALSITMARAILPTADLIAALRADERTARVMVIVGGHMLDLAPGLWRRVGADACAPDAVAAIRTSERLLGLQPEAE